MKRLSFTIISILLSSLVFGQVVSTDPIFPKENESVVITFNASEGDSGLEGFSGDIWAHTGVLTDKSSSPGDWKYVIAGWSENTDKAKLKSLGGDLWELEISPSIREFYAVPDNETIESLAFVFRNADGSTTGRDTDGGDVFVEIYEEGLHVTITQPSAEFIQLEAGQQVLVEATATFADSVQVLLDEARIYSVVGNLLNYSLEAAQEGVHEVVVKAFASGEDDTDEFSFLIKGSSNVAEVPEGLNQGVNYLSDTEVTFVLYAPEKEFVFLIGDFNEWNIDTDYLMSRSQDEKYYWITVDSLVPNKEYIFQYFVDGEIRIADPYTNKTSDPWNDQHISEAIYPGLIPYPAGYTSQIASVLQTAQEDYVWSTEEFSAPDKENVIYYELLIRDFLANHTFNGLIDTLDYIQNLGVNAIKIMPVSEFEGNESWGYNPSFYFAVDKYYGPANTFKAFIDSAHSRGLAVVMDMVLNHSFGQSPLARLYWDSENNRPAENNPWYNTVSPNPVFAWGSDFDHDSEDTKRFIDSVNSYWLTEYKIDGFRFDFTKGFTNTPGDGGAYDADRIAHLKRMSDKIWEVNPEAYVLLEHFAENSEETELANYGMMIWANMNYSYRIAAKGYLSGGVSDLSWVSYKERGWNNAHLVGYMESHDEERLNFITQLEGNSQNADHNARELDISLKRMEICANFFIPVPGPKMIWMFGELGYDYSIEYNGRTSPKPIKWDYYDQHLRQRLYQVYCALGQLKHEYPVFQTSDFVLDVRNDVKRIHLNHQDMNVTILGNFSTWDKSLAGQFQHAGWWYDYWTGDSLLVEDTEALMDFKASEYRLYTDVKLETPDILSGLNHIELEENNIQLKVYPNPIGTKFTLDLEKKNLVDKIEVFTVTGQKLDEINNINALSSFVIDSSTWPEGIILIICTGDFGQEIVKVIK